MRQVYASMAAIMRLGDAQRRPARPAISALTGPAFPAVRQGKSVQTLEA